MDPSTAETTEHLGGIEVTFPYKPYGLQKAFMSKVVSCVSESKNGLLESPTGTGKTLSLLCASLAWLKIKREEEKKAKLEQEKLEHVEEEIIEIERPEKPYMKYRRNPVTPNNWKQKGTRIVYSSRTHMQLSQAISEMKKTNYNDMNGIVLGSRDQYCLNSEVMNLESVAAKNHACRAKTNHSNCPFYSQYESRLHATNDYTETPVHDIEDLVTLGKRHILCPYYASKVLANRADIMFVPYNYLIDKHARKSQEIALQDAVVIIDEGHNIERSLEDTASTELSSQTLDSCIKYLGTLCDEMNNQEDEVSVVDENLTKALKRVNVRDVAKLKNSLFDFQKELDRFVVSVNEEKVFFPEVTVYRLLDNSSFDWGSLKLIVDIVTYLIERSTVIPSVSSVINSLSRLENFFDVLLPDDVANGECKFDVYQQSFKKNFKVFAVKDTKPPRFAQMKNNWLRKPKEPETTWTLNVLCLTPSVAMHSLLECGVRSCIITSGTLAPLNTFEAELHVPFPVTLQNKHIIKSDSLRVFAIGRGKCGEQNEPFNSAYTNRTNIKYNLALGDAVSKYVRIIPGGVFLFFSSYTLMYSCIDSWKERGYWHTISSAKETFTESRNKITFDGDFRKFKAAVDEPGSRGALFLGVCRGKLSEGLDAGDQYCRAVIVAGLPFPAQYEPRVHLKRKYLDENKSANSMSSTTWYQLQMTRAVNQAIGRIIRHKDDHGVVLLLDIRFSQWKHDLSSWIREYYRESSLDESLASIKKFFMDKIVKKAVDEPEPNKLGLQAGVRRKFVNDQPSNSTFVGQYTEESPRKKGCHEEPRNAFQILNQATSQNVNKKFKVPTFVCDISPIKSNKDENKRRFNVPLVTIQATVEEEPPKVESEKSLIDELKEQSTELKQLFAGTKKFDRMCSAMTKYRNHKNLRCFMYEIKWIFDGVGADQRARNIRVLSKAVTNLDERDLFLKWLDVEVK